MIDNQTPLDVPKEKVPKPLSARVKAMSSAEPKIEIWRTILHAILCNCPRCGRGPLFHGLLQLEPRCVYCGLSYEFADSGDGPAVFVILIGGFLALGAMLWIAASFELSPLMQFFISLPVVLGVCLALLRPFKALLIGLQYRNKAVESKFSAKAMGNQVVKASVKPAIKSRDSE